MSKPLIAIVGRPNVGKSTLFNRLVRQRKAIVESEPGVTRDRLYADAAWTGRLLTVIDTGGLDWDGGDAIQEKTTRQAEMAIAEADVIIFVVDVTAGITPADQAVADVLRRSRKPVILAVNKVDDPGREDQAMEFFGLGLKAEIIPLSAYHGVGTGDLLDTVLEHLPEGKTGEPDIDQVAESVEPPPADDGVAGTGLPGRGEGDSPGEAGEGDEAGAKAAGGQTGRDVPRRGPRDAPGPGEPGCAALPIRVAVVGRPNVGKSSLVNLILGSERVIVADRPGTTRDAIDIPIERDGCHYILVDTAGLRKKARIKENVERYSILRTLRAVDRCDVVLLLFDASDTLVEQDKRVAGYAVEAGRGLVLAVNKWDLVPKDNLTYLGYEAALRKGLHYADWAPIVFSSAKTGHNLGRLLDSVRTVAVNQRRRISTAAANRVFRDAVALNPPPSEGRRRLRVSYVTQATVVPPTFVFFVNTPELVTDSYRRYLEGRARETWDFTGTPLRLAFRAKRSQ